jgi:hypothetical protein
VQEFDNDMVLYERHENTKLRSQLQVVQNRLEQTQQQLYCLHQSLQHSPTGIVHAIMTASDGTSNNCFWELDSIHTLLDTSRELKTYPQPSLGCNETCHPLGHPTSNQEDNTSTTTPLEPSAAERLRHAHATIVELEFEKVGVIVLMARAYVSMPLLESQPPTRQMDSRALFPPSTKSVTITKPHTTAAVACCCYRPHLPSSYYRRRV